MVAFYGRRRKSISMSFLIPNFTKKGVKEMQTLKAENVIDLSLLKEDFFLEILNLITKAKEEENALSQK